MIEYEIVKNKKLASCLVNEATCRKRFGAEIANSLIRLIGQLSKILDMRELYGLPGRFHRLRHLPLDNVYSITLKHPFRCIMRLDVASSTITIEEVCDYHGHYEKLFRK